MILMAALLTASIAQAAEPDDTVTVYNAHKVTVVSNDSLLQVEVDGTDRQPDYHYQTTLRNTDGNYESTSVTGDLWRTRQTLWSAVQMLTQKLCCQTIHDCPKVVPLHYESE